MAVELDGAVVLVTGGANGIGAAAAGRLASRGAHVVVADVDERGTDVAAGTGGLFVRCDVREPADNEAAVAAAIAAFGGLDVAFLNAGVSTTSVRLGTSAWDLAAYRRACAINVDGVFFGVNAALPALRDRGRGALVLTASLAGLTAVPDDPIYAATKHAVVGLARALGPALAADHVAVNALCPGFADTAIKRAGPASDRRGGHSPDDARRRGRRAAGRPGQRPHRPGLVRSAGPGRQPWVSVTCQVPGPPMAHGWAESRGQSDLNRAVIGIAGRGQRPAQRMGIGDVDLGRRRDDGQAAE